MMKAEVTRTLFKESIECRQVQLTIDNQNGQHTDHTDTGRYPVTSQNDMNGN